MAKLTGCVSEKCKKSCTDLLISLHSDMKASMSEKEEKILILAQMAKSVVRSTDETKMTAFFNRLTKTLHKLKDGESNMKKNALGILTECFGKLIWEAEMTILASDRYHDGVIRRNRPKRLVTEHD